MELTPLCQMRWVGAVAWQFLLRDRCRTGTATFAWPASPALVPGHVQQYPADLYSGKQVKITYTRGLHLLESSKESQESFVQHAFCLMEIPQARKILVKYFSGQKSQTFIDQLDQFGAGRAIAVAHAVEQLL